MQCIHTHYNTLKVARDAPTEVIKSAYRALARKYHPDSNPNLEEAVREMQALNQAFEVLTDPVQRKTHDEWIDQQIGGNPAGAGHQSRKRDDKSSSKGDQRDSRKYPAAGKIWSGWPSFDKLKPGSITLIMALAAGIFAGAAYAGPATPPPGSAERRAICDALRVPVVEEFGVKPIFVIQTLNVLDNWAFLYADLKREDGSTYNVEEIYRKLTGETRACDGNDIYGLLRKENGRWKVAACAVAPTDVAYADWHRRFGAPKAVFGKLATNLE